MALCEQPHSWSPKTIKQKWKKSIQIRPKSHSPDPVEGKNPATSLQKLVSWPNLPPSDATPGCGNPATIMEIYTSPMLRLSPKSGLNFEALFYNHHDPLIFP